MPSVYDFKPKFQALLRPLMRRLVSVGCTPNTITLLALIGSGIVGALLLKASHASTWLLLLPFWLFARMALNAIDGMMAREYNMVTTVGAILNEVGDVVSDLVIYLPFAVLDVRSRWPVVAFCFGAALTEFCGVLTQSLGTKRHYEGPMGKSDRAFVMGVVAFVTFWWEDARQLWPWVFGGAAALTILTCWNRLAKAMTELKP